MILKVGTEVVAVESQRSSPLIDAKLAEGGNDQGRSEAGHEKAKGAAEDRRAHGDQKAIVLTGAHLTDRLVGQGIAGYDEEDGYHGRT